MTDIIEVRDELAALGRRVATLESREASLPGAIGHMIRLHLEGSVAAAPQVAGGDTDLGAAMERVRHIVGLSPDDQDPFGADVIAVCDALKRSQEDERKTITCWERQAATIKQMQLELDSAREAERGAKERLGLAQEKLARISILAGSSTPAAQAWREIREVLAGALMEAPTPAAPCATEVNVIGLLPCPFCGATDGIELFNHGHGRFQYYVCGSCDAYGPEGHTLEGAKSAWNRRPLSLAETKAVERE